MPETFIYLTLSGYLYSPLCALNRAEHRTPSRVRQMGNKDYIRGFTDALEMTLLELRRARDLEDAKKRIEGLLARADNPEELMKRLWGEGL